MAFTHLDPGSPAYRSLAGRERPDRPTMDGPDPVPVAECCTVEMGDDLICPECGWDWNPPYSDESKEMYAARMEDGVRRDPARYADRGE